MSDDVSEEEQDPGIVDRQPGMGRSHRIWETLEPAAKRELLTGVDQRSIGDLKREAA